jgi:hypothetical protein
LDKNRHLPDFDITGNENELCRLQLKISKHFKNIRSNIDLFFNEISPINEIPIKQHFRDNVWEELIKVVWSPARIKYWWHEIEYPVDED